jgi:hypothetical protein
MEGSRLKIQVTEYLSEPLLQRPIHFQAHRNAPYRIADRWITEIPDCLTDLSQTHSDVPPPDKHGHLSCRIPLAPAGRLPRFSPDFCHGLGYPRKLQMIVIRHQCIAMDPHPELLHHQAKQLLKLLLIGFSVENEPSFHATINHMIPRSRNQNSQCSRHDPLSRASGIS